MKYEFDYDRAKVSTTDQITVSIADLRDLVNASFLADKAGVVLEVSELLKSIEHKNRLPQNCFSVNLV